MITIEVAPKESIIIGGTWKKTLNLVPESGSLTIISATHYLMAKDSTSDVSATYVTGSASVSGSQLTTGQVGTGSIPPGDYTYFVLVTTAANVYVLYKNFEFITMQGL